MNILMEEQPTKAPMSEMSSTTQQTPLKPDEDGGSL